MNRVPTNQNLIDGRWVGSPDTGTNINPSDTGDVVSEYAVASAEQVDEAVAAAHRARRAWAEVLPEQRAAILDRAAAIVDGRAEAIGRLLSREEGKTLPEGIAETRRAASILRFFAGEALRWQGSIHPSVRSGVEVLVTRNPVGVVGVVTPWNFPIAIPAWKIAPALAYGNCVVWKPAELVPASAHALAQALDEAGIPAGVLNLVLGKGSVVGQRIVEHPLVAAVTFTGSTEVGTQVAVDCARRLAAVQLEMGGKNPLVVADDADLAQAVQIAVQGAFYSTGQRCTASSRIIVSAAVHDEFLDRFVAATEALRVGDALDPAVQIGPVVSAGQLESVQQYVKVGAGEGAELVTGGGIVEADRPGFFMRPAVFAGASNAMRIAREEIFGPVATVIEVADLDEAIEVANDTDFGLAAGICTTSLAASTRFRQRIEAGIVTVNLPTAGVDFHVPFGGRKSSSYGPKEQGRAAMEFFTESKTTYVAS